MHKLLISLLIICILSVIIVPISFGNSYVWSDYDLTTTVSSNLSEKELILESPSAILIEQNSGKILFEKNSHEKLRPASVTKVMSILLIMEALDLRKNNFR